MTGRILKATFLSLVTQLSKTSAIEQTYKSTNDNRCIFNNVQALQNYSSITSARQCSKKCFMTSNCSLFMTDDSTDSCLLYSAMYYLYYLEVSYYRPKKCRIWYTSWKITGILFKTDSLFTVPADVNFIKALVVGGGSGACNGNFAAGGSGYVAYGTIYVSGGQNITVKVGKGGIGQIQGPNPTCVNAKDGGNSTFGGIFAKGGFAAVAEPSNGGDGGSGGGCSAAGILNALSGTGGSAGSHGGNGSNSYVGGEGQGASFTSSFSQFVLTKITAGSGAAGIQGVEPYRYGGGGAGGVLLNNTGPKAGGGACLSGKPSICGPGNATGYGASGSAGCRQDTSEYTTGGNGADGVVYIECY